MFIYLRPLLIRKQIKCSTNCVHGIHTIREICSLNHTDFSYFVKAMHHINLDNKLNTSTDYTPFGTQFLYFSSFE